MLVALPVGSAPQYPPPPRQHFCTCLAGDAVDVFRQLRAAFRNARRAAAHVVMTCSIRAAAATAAADSGPAATAAAAAPLTGQ